MTRRWKIVLGVAIALLALRVALPALLARVIERQASAALGRAVQVENVDLFLPAGHVTLEELLVGPPLDPEAATAPIDPETALIHWPHALLNFGWLGLFAGELRIQRVEVVGGRERLVLQADHRLEPLVVARRDDFRGSESNRVGGGRRGLAAGRGREGGWLAPATRAAGARESHLPPDRRRRLHPATDRALPGGADGGGSRPRRRAALGRAGGPSQPAPSGTPRPPDRRRPGTGERAAGGIPAARGSGNRRSPTRLPPRVVRHRGRAARHPPRGGGVRGRAGPLGPRRDARAQ